MSDPQGVVAHYGSDDLIETVTEALRDAGLGEGTLTWQALAPLDQFHVRGVAATAELADRLALRPGTRVLDVGCGLGGPARHLVAVYGADVTGIDLNPNYVALATMLTERAGLSARVRHVLGDALALAFEPESFDVVWTQHVAMNIADRQALYGGIRRVLVPGGRLAIYDVIAGSGLLHFPVPWARRPDMSFVVSESDMKQVLERVGLGIDGWSDVTDAAVAWFQAHQKDGAGRAPPPRLALPLVMGPEFPAMTANLARNLAEGRARLLQAVLRRPI